MQPFGNALAASSWQPCLMHRRRDRVFGCRRAGLIVISTSLVSPCVRRAPYYAYANRVFTIKFSWKGRMITVIYRWNFINCPAAVHGCCCFFSLNYVRENTRVSWVLRTSMNNASSIVCRPHTFPFAWYRGMHEKSRYKILIRQYDRQVKG